MRLRELDPTEIGNAVDRVSAYIDAPTLEPEQKIAVVDFLKSEFGILKVEDLGAAVKAVFSNRIEPSQDISRISKQSVAWFGAILSAYKKHISAENRRNEMIKPEDFNQPVLQMNNSNEGHNQHLYESLESIYLNSGKLPIAWAWKQARKHASANGILKVYARDESECMEIARSYLSDKMFGVSGNNTKITDLEKNKAILQLHFSRLHD